MGNYLVVGLGNIGSEYANTRHNMGFMVLDAWAQASNTVFSVDRYGSVLNLRLKGNVITLLKPSTYMNLSGKAVRYWLDRLKVPVSNLLVISDDLNLPYGTMRMRKNGSSGGHNGLENISMLLGTDEYARLRLGIGHDFGRGGQVDFVLGELRSHRSSMSRLSFFVGLPEPRSLLRKNVSIGRCSFSSSSAGVMFSAKFPTSFAPCLFSTVSITLNVNVTSFFLAVMTSPALTVFDGLATVPLMCILFPLQASVASALVL